MTARDWATLRQYLSHLNRNELFDYRALYVSPPSRMERMRRDVVLKDICRSILDVASMEERLRRMARIYCWLIPRRMLRSWRLYLHDSEADLAVHCPTLFERIAAALRIPDYTVQMTWEIVGDATYACLLAQDEENRPLEHKPVCIALWSGLPFLAVQVERDDIECRFSVALSAALVGDSFTLLDGIHDDLDSALCAGSTFVSQLRDDASQGAQHIVLFREAPTVKDNIPAEEVGTHSEVGHPLPDLSTLNI